ncbi:MAG: ribosomal protein S18-alanine N-acetyltransferase [Desulfurococcaceae archaeon]
MYILIFKSKDLVEKRRPGVDELFNEAIRRMETKARGFEIRLAREEDLFSVRDLNYTCLPENYPFEFFYELWKNHGKSFYVSQSPDNKIVGYVMCRVEIKPGFYKKLLVKSGHIVSLAVLHDYRRIGLGYALMAYAMKSLYNEYGCEETYLEVRVSNTPAINLYEKLGYEKIRVIKNYYLDGEDAYLMARPLP